MARQNYQLEYPLEHASSTQLWALLSTAQGLSSWIDAEVVIDQEMVTFHWTKTEFAEATVSIDSQAHEVTFRWKHDIGGFSLKLHRSELTKEQTLVILDECDEEDYDSSLQIWKRQVTRLYRALGLKRNA